MGRRRRRRRRSSSSSRRWWRWWRRWRLNNMWRVRRWFAPVAEVLKDSACTCANATVTTPSRIFAAIKCPCFWIPQRSQISFTIADVPPYLSVFFQPLVWVLESVTQGVVPVICRCTQPTHPAPTWELKTFVVCKLFFCPWLAAIYEIRMLP